MQIRRAEITDLEAITSIYNDAIVKTAATFDTIPRTMAEQESWFRNHGPRHPVMVAVDGMEVIGWASLSQWSGRCAYADSAEASVYIAEKFRGRGIGRKLLTAILDAGAQAGLHTIISNITGNNDVSVHLHEELGFQTVGVLKEVGKKFGQLWDVRIMQKLYTTK